MPEEKSEILNQQDMEYVCDYMLNMGRAMLSSGASLERTQDAIIRTCHAYGLGDISLYALSSFLSLSCRNDRYDGVHSQTVIGPVSFQMQRLNQLNDLSRVVCRDRPEPKLLSKMLDLACEVKPYTRVQICLGNLLALLCLLGIFGGSRIEIPAICIIVPVVTLVGRLFDQPKIQISKFIIEMAEAFTGGLVSVLYTKLVPDADVFVLLITTAFMLIPGIPIINSIRNIMTGNEMNGAIELMKVILETLTIVSGLAAAMILFY